MEDNKSNKSLTKKYRRTYLMIAEGSSSLQEVYLLSRSNLNKTMFTVALNLTKVIHLKNLTQLNRILKGR